MDYDKQQILKRKLANVPEQDRTLATYLLEMEQRIDGAYSIVENVEGIEELMVEEDLITPLESLKKRITALRSEYISES